MAVLWVLLKVEAVEGGGGRDAGGGEGVRSPSSWENDGIVGFLPTFITWRRSDDAAGEGRCLKGLAEDSGAGLSFFCKNSSLRLVFLLMVEGLSRFFGVGLTLESKEGAISLVAREKEKLDPREREKEKAIPWLASAWQKSMHLMAKGESTSVEGAVIVKCYF